MFKYVENLVDRYIEGPPGVPSSRLWPFIGSFVAPFRSVIILNLLTSLSGWIMGSLSVFFRDLGVISEGMESVAQPVGLLDEPGSKNLILDKGRIAERGTHDDLMSRGGLYATLLQHQSGGFFVADS